MEICSNPLTTFLSFRFKSQKYIRHPSFCRVNSLYILVIGTHQYFFIYSSFRPHISIRKWHIINVVINNGQKLHIPLIYTCKQGLTLVATYATKGAAFVIFIHTLVHLSYGASNEKDKCIEWSRYSGGLALKPNRRNFGMKNIFRWVLKDRKLKHFSDFEKLVNDVCHYFNTVQKKF